MVLSSGQISFMGEASLAVSSRKTALFHTEPNILALKKNSSLCPWSWLAEEILKEAIRVPCFSPCSIVYWVEEWSQNTFTNSCEEVLQRNLEPNKPLRTKWVWLHTHRERPTSALWSFFQIGEGILEPKKKILFWTKWVGQSTQTEAHISILDWGRDSWTTKPNWDKTGLTTCTFYGHSLPSTYSRREVVSYLQKNVHRVLVNRLVGRSLPRKSVVRLTDHPTMTIAVDRGC